MATANTTYPLGSSVTVSASFDNNTTGLALDPTAVKFAADLPGSSACALTYGVDAALVKDATGRYHVAVDADVAGVYQYRWYSTGTGKAAATGVFEVEAWPV